MGHVGELASAYLDGETTPEESERLRRHLAACDACRNEVADIHLARSALRAMPTLEMPVELLERLDLVPPVVPLRHRPPMWIAAAAAALIMFVTFAAAVTPDPVGVPLVEVSHEYQEQLSLGSAVVPNVGAVRAERIRE